MVCIFLRRLSRVVLSLAIGCLASAAWAQEAAPRERLLMDFGWQFINGDPSDAGNIFEYPEVRQLDKTTSRDVTEGQRLAASRKDPVALNLGADVSYVKPDFDAKSWRKLDLPHDWVVELPFNPRGNSSHGKKDIDRRTGTNIGWYRRDFDLPAGDKGKTLWIEFDGVFRNSLVWLNGRCLGRHPSGYSSFMYDITKHANFGGKNTLVVRVDASRTEGWFYEGGGIYRHVWLVKTDPVHVAHWGTYVTTRELTPGNFAVTVEVAVRNDTDAPRAVRVNTRFLDPDGQRVTLWGASSGLQIGGAFGRGEVPAHGEVVLRMTGRVPNARLWSIEKPQLYRAVTTIREDQRVADVYETPFGIRTIRFDPEKGFFLNGQHVLLKGTCNHQDHAGVGAALPDRVNYFRIERLKEMGCNAYRTSHNPPTPELLDACDRLGMLVMDEARRMEDSPEVLGELESLIRRDRNHPSVVIWSLGNEEFQIQGDDNLGARIATAMQDRAHELDPGRPATIAINAGFGRGFSKVVEVMGFNYNLGEIDGYREKYQAKPAVGTETASTLCTRGIYANDSSACFMSAYDDNAPKWGATAEKWWTFYMVRPYLAGGFVWTGFDYRGEPTPYNAAYSSQFGIMDTCGFAKDNFFYYQAWWSDKTVLHLLPHWNWAGKEGQEIDVRCFSNCDAVELFLNGASLGKQEVPRNSHVKWKVKYAPGTLSAKGYRGGEVVAETKVETAGAPVAVKLTSDRPTINADGEDVAIVTVAVVDAQGRTVPTADNEIVFAVSGGRIIGVGNGHPNSTESDKAEKRKLFSGLAQVIVQSNQEPGTIVLTASSQGLSQATLTLQAQRVALRPAVAAGMSPVR